MKPLCPKTISAALILCACASWAQKPDFVVAHSMTYKGGVDISAYGIRYNSIIYESSLLPSGTSDAPATKEALKILLDRITPGPLPTVLDIERWPTSEKDLELNGRNVTKLVDVVNLVRSVRPDLKYGYYGVLPTRIYWPLVDLKQARDRNDWVANNKRMKESLAPHVDAIFPSLYTFFDDAPGWKTYAEATLIEAETLGKPTYCYLWPRFHPSNKKLDGQLISATFWRMQLETCRKYADGIVIWDYSPDQPWNPEAAWWKETLAFMQTIGPLPRR